MAMGKANAENKEEEELVTAPLQTKALNEAKRCSAPSSQVSCPTFPRRSRNPHQFLDHVGLQMQATKHCKSANSKLDLINPNRYIPIARPVYTLYNNL